MGKKYIIELEEPEIFDERKFYTCTQMPWWAVSEKIVENLTPYTEPDLEQVRKEAYDKGHDDAKCGYENGFEIGMIVAWDAARKIACDRAHGGFHIDIKQHIFGAADYAYILANYNASEAVEKIRSYEQEKEELEIQGYFKKGEEVIDADGTKAVIMDVSEDNYCQVYTENGCIENWHIHTYKFHKTGKTHPEVESMLANMRRENGE